MTESHFDLVIFDCDGVLVDSEPIINRAHVVRVVALAAFPGHTPPFQPAVDRGMRLILVFALSASLLCGCTPFIPIKDEFGTSALRPTGNIPPEFAEFNNFDPQVNAAVADQVCTTPYILLTEKSLRAAPGEIVAWSGRCEPYEIRIDNLAEHFSP